MLKKITMALTIAAILTALMLSNQAFAQSAAGQEAKQFPGGQLPPGFNPGGPIQLPGGGGYNGGNGFHITSGPCHKIAPGKYVC
jgi:hypothetical protein